MFAVPHVRCLCAACVLLTGRMGTACCLCAVDQARTGAVGQIHLLFTSDVSSRLEPRHMKTNRDWLLEQARNRLDDGKQVFQDAMYRFLYSDYYAYRQPTVETVER